MKSRFTLLSLLLAFGRLSAQDQIPPADKPTPGDIALTAYFQNEVAALSNRCLADIKTPADWNNQRGEYRRQLREMLGLWPMPERTDLHPVITGREEQDGFTVEKLQFQASPHLYVTANLFLPSSLTNSAPCILYECGHWRLLTNGISYGNKAIYQMDGAWYARNGYVCLVPDSLLAGEIQGIHTGTRDKGLWWWNSRGYTPAGVEAWFGIRALDYLCTRAEVDTNRFGITGHSGGGAYSWTVTALDDRIKVAAPLAGMTDLHRHICDNLMDKHCDCNFPINIYRWDFPQLAALVAPRPLLIGGTDHDPIFPPAGTLAIHQKLATLYKTLDASSNLALCIGTGVHDEVPELRLAVLRWFNQHLKGVALTNKTPVLVDDTKFLAPEQVRVFKDLPADNINSNIADTFVPTNAGRDALPRVQPENLRTTLRAKVFAAWPADDLPLEPQCVFSVERDGAHCTAWDFTSQHDVTLRLYLLENAKAKGAGNVQLTVLDSSSWPDWIATTNKLSVPNENVALAFLAPRGVGPTTWSGDDKRLTKIRRRFALLGETLDSMHVWDIRRAIQTIHFVRENDPAKVELKASGSMAANALYAALFEPNVNQLDLTGLPKSHTEGPDYLGVLKITDIPEVVDAVAAHASVKQSRE